jgi:glutamyl-tRNA reductase
LEDDKNAKEAVQLAKKFNGYAIRLENNLENIVIKSDVVITATSSPHVIIKKDFLEKLFQKNIIKKEILFIDLSVPRNIEPEVDEIDNVLLYDLDKIKQIIDNNYNNRILEKEKAETIIETEVENLYNKLNSGLLYKNFSTKLSTIPV